MEDENGCGLVVIVVVGLVLLIVHGWGWAVPFFLILAGCAPGLLPLVVGILLFGAIFGSRSE